MFDIFEPCSARLASKCAKNLYMTFQKLHKKSTWVSKHDAYLLNSAQKLHIYANYTTVENGTKKFLRKMFRHKCEDHILFFDSGKNFRVVTYS